MNELLDAQTLYQQSRDKYVEAFTNYELKKREYLQATGRWGKSVIQAHRKRERVFSRGPTLDRRAFHFSGTHAPHVSPAGTETSVAYPIAFIYLNT